MCGIAGYIHLDKNRTANPDLIRGMTDCIAHRGPDGEGFYVKDNLALGHRRLAIIDPASGHQPMFSDDGLLSLVFNGEIYNYIELREELRTFGYKFRTGSDTEVLLKAYQHWGIDCQKKFNGMWSFALHDSRTNELFISRDRIGEKPLHYTATDQTLIFGSELKSIFRYGVKAAIREELLELYLFLTYIPTPDTFYRGIYKLRPGHYIRVSGGSFLEIKYWDLPELDETRMLKDKTAVYETFGRLFEDSVRIRMRSDVSFGAFLSGGLDSSSVVATMAGISSMPVETFTIGYADPNFDESQLAWEVAKRFATNHHAGTVNFDSFNTSLQRAVNHFDEPFGDSSAIPTAFVSRFASEKVKMILTGDGGDEVLSGYNAYLGLKIAEQYRCLPPVIQRNFPKFTRWIAGFTRNKIRYKLNRVAQIAETASLPLVDRMAHKMAYADFSLIKMLTGGLKVIPIEQFLADFFGRYNLRDDFYRMMFFDFKHSLPDDYLVKVDRMGMSHSIETRIPFLDHRLIEYMVGVDKNVKMQGWENKSVLRNSIGRKLPVAILRAPKKGFGIPVREWFKEKTFDDSLGRLRKMPLLDRAAIDKLIEENSSGKRDNGNFIWALFVLNEFLPRDRRQ